jgi:glycosyltransferase involved in cell wall biosynthesis
MIRVAALTSGRSVPSTRFRLRQHIEPLKHHGILVREHVPFVDKYSAVPGIPPGYPVRLAPQFYAWQALKLGSRLPGIVASWKSQVTWLERELLPGRMSLEHLLGNPLVFDVDDAIWLASPRAGAAAASIARRASVVVAGNAYLAAWLSDHNPRVEIVPTAIDTERFRPALRDERTGRFVIGWTGSAATLPYLEELERPLKRVLEEHPLAQLTVIADRAPVLRSIAAERVTFIPWSAAVEAEALREFDVGIMPLPETPWTRGKCSFKMLQYMSTGLPVVVSPVGMNAEILRMGLVGIAAGGESDWVEALSHLLAHRQEARAMGLEGRAIVEQHFSRSRVSERLAEIIARVV